MSAFARLIKSLDFIVFDRFRSTCGSLALPVLAEREKLEYIMMVRSKLLKRTPDIDPLKIVSLILH
jgi:hypothetical protein